MSSIYPSLHLPRDKELGMSLIQFSVLFGPYLKPLVKLTNCYAQFRPVSSLEWTFLKNSSARLLWHLPQFWLATSLMCWTDGVNKKLSLGPLSARYLWGQTNKDIMDPPSKSPTTTTSAHWRSNLWMEVLPWKWERRLYCGNLNYLHISHAVIEMDVEFSS